MNKRLNPRRAASSPSRKQQRGVVLLFSLIALVIMLIVAVALVRSFNNSLFTAGNIGFKRDMQNQSELAVSLVLAQFQTTTGPLALGTPALRSASVTSKNYSATMLSTNAQGVPDALVSTSFTAGNASNDLGASGVNVRYLIDRLCSITGDETTFTAATDSCRLAGDPVPAGTSLSNLKSADRTINGVKGAATQAILYRLSIKVTGPRNTQSFFQSTFTVPST